MTQGAEQLVESHSAKEAGRTSEMEEDEFKQLLQKQTQTQTQTQLLQSDVGMSAP